MGNHIKPTSIRLEASSICQLKCVACSQTKGLIGKSITGHGFLKFTHFKKLIDDNPWIKNIELSNYGEIFLNPEILEIIKYGFQKKIKLTANNGVNLNYITEEVLEGLVKYKFHSMNCSIDGCSNEIYQIYRVNGDYDTVIKHIKKINQFKEKYNSPYPLLKWQFIIFGHNEHQIPLAEKKARELKMAFKLKPNWDRQYSPTIKNKDLEKKLSASHSVCGQLWDFPQINWDGKILGCCSNFKLDFGGNVFEDGLLNCLNSKKMKYARLMLQGKKPSQEGIPCSQCKHYLKLRQEGKIIKRKNIFGQLFQKINNAYLTKKCVSMLLKHK